MLVLAQPALAHLDIRPTPRRAGCGHRRAASNCPSCARAGRRDRLEVEGDGIEVISSDLQGTSGSDTRLERPPPRDRGSRRRCRSCSGRCTPTASRWRSTSSSRWRPRPETSGVPLGRRRRRRAAGGRGRRVLAPPRPPESLIASRLVLFQQFVDDDLGCASYLVGDEDAGVAAIVDPPYAIEPVLAEAAKREVRDRADDRDAHARRPPLRPRPARARARRADLDPPGRRGGVRARSAGRRRRARARRRRPARDPHARAPSRAHLPRRDRPLAGGRAVARADRRLALRRRRGPSGPRGRRAGGRRRALPLAAAAARAAGRRRGLPRPRRRLALRQGDELEGLLDDRLRAPLQPRAPDRARGRLRRRLGLGVGAEAAEHDPARGAEPRPTRRRRRRRGRAADRARRRDRARRPPRPRVPRRPRPRGAERARLGHLVRDEGRRSCSTRRRRSSSRRRTRPKQSAPSAASAPSASSSSRATCSATARSGSRRSASTSSTSC